jgi:Ca2+-binding EF-hand superfamily protein
VTDPLPSLRRFDKDRNYKIDRSEWLDFYTSEGGKHFHAYKIFNDADVNRDGYINFDHPDELQRVENIMKSTQ